MKIAVNLPSIYPERLRQWLYNFGKLSNRDKFIVHVVGQPPVTRQPHGCDLFTLVDEKPVNMLNLFLLTMKAIEADYYMRVDDDLQYHETADRFFDTIISALKKHKPSVISLFGSNKSNIGNLINPRKCCITTNRGLIIGKFDYSRLDNLPFHGPCEDAMIGYEALYQKYHHMVFSEAPIERRYQQRITSDATSPIHKIKDYHKYARAYIREWYQDPKWEIWNGEFPFLLQKLNPGEIQ